MSELRAWIEKLNALSPCEIRDLLVAEGVTGTHDDAHCPIAVLLRRKGAARCPSVVPRDTIDYGNDLSRAIAVSHGPSIHRFVLDFDLGRLPRARGPTERGGTVIDGTRNDDTAELRVVLGEAFHTALRKVGTSGDSWQAYQAINRMDPEEWDQILRAVVTALNTTNGKST